MWRVLVLVLFSLPAQAQDSWTGHDKALHFGVSVAAGYFCRGFLFQGPDDELRALGCGVAPGLVKELIDAGEPGNKFSGKDLVWDIAGAYVGVKFGGWVIRKNFIGYQWQLP